MRALASCLLALFFVLPARDARAEPIEIPVTLSTSGTFFCLSFAPCFSGEGTNQLTIPTGSGDATITFTGVDETFSLTNTTQRQVTIGHFSVTAPPGFTFPTNFANPALPVFGFRFIAEGLFDSDQLFLTLGPGGGTTLQMFGLLNFSVPPDVDPSPWQGVVFETNPAIIGTNVVTNLTADGSVVPEPSTMLLIGSGLLALARMRRQA